MRIPRIELSIYKIGLILLVLTFPLANSDLFSIYHPKLFPARVILTALLAFGLFSFLKKAVARKHRFFWQPFLDDRLLKILVALLLVRAVSLVNSLNLTASFQLLAFYTSMIGFYLLLKFVAGQDFGFLLKLFKTHLVLVSAIGLYGLLQAILPFFGIVLPGVLLGGTFIRVPATFYDANHLPPYLLSALPFILVLGWLSQDSKRRWLFFSAAGFLSLVIFLTFSRSGIFGFGIAVLVLLLYLARFGYWRKISLIFSLLLPVALFIILSSQTQFSLTKRLLSSFSSADKSTMAHTALLYGEFKLFLENPVLGVGYGSFSEHFRRSKIGVEHTQFDPATHVRIPPHSLWLETLAETGILGFSLYLALMLIIFETLLKALRKVTSTEHRLKLTAILASFLGILSAGIFYSYNLEFFWFFLLFAFLYSRRILSSNDPALFAARREEEKISWDEVCPLVFLMVFSGLLIFAGLGQRAITDGREAFSATLAKNILRAFQVQNKDFWLLKYPFGGAPWLKNPPLFFYLNALFMFFYDVTNFSARFLSAAFGLGNILLTYLLGRKFFGKKTAALASFLLPALPFFLKLSRTGTAHTAYLFFFLTLFHLYLLARKNSGFWLPWGFFLGLTFLLDQRFSLLMILFSLFLAGYDFFFVHATAPYRNILFPSSLLVSVIVALPWYFRMYKMFGPSFISSWRQGFSGNYAADFLPLYLPFISLLLASMLRRFLGTLFYKRKTFLVIFALVFVLSSLNWAVSLPSERYKEELYLIAKRHEISRAGVIPIITSIPVVPTFWYYSDIPLRRLEGEKLLAEFREEKTVFTAIIDGEDFAAIREELVGTTVATRVIDSAKNLVLVEKQ